MQSRCDAVVWFTDHIAELSFCGADATLEKDQPAQSPTFWPWLGARLCQIAGIPDSDSREFDWCVPKEARSAATRIGFLTSLAGLCCQLRVLVVAAELYTTAPCSGQCRLGAL